jgi:hypothetical protein
MHRTDYTASLSSVYSIVSEYLSSVNRYFKYSKILLGLDRNNSHVTVKSDLRLQ